MIKTIDIGVIHSKIRRTQIFIIPRHLDAVDMRSEITFRNTAESFMVDFFRDLADAAIFAHPQRRNLSIMITAYKKKPVFVIRRKVAAPHAVNASFIDLFQISRRQDAIGFYAEIRNGI